MTRPEFVDAAQTLALILYGLAILLHSRNNHERNHS